MRLPISGFFVTRFCFEYSSEGWAQPRILPNIFMAHQVWVPIGFGSLSDLVCHQGSGLECKVFLKQHGRRQEGQGTQNCCSQLHTVQ